MTDERPWQAPGDSPAPPSNPPLVSPQAGVPVEAQPTPGYYLPPPQPGVSAGWTPPPKPGLIPLRPLSFGTLLGASFRVLRRNPRPTFGVALLVESVAIVLSLVLVGGITFLSISRVSSATSEDEATIVAGTIGIGIVSGLITLFFSLIAGAILQGVIVVEVARGTLGEKLPLRKLWGFAKSKIWALVGWASIIAAAMLIAIAIVTGVIVLMVSTMGGIGIALSVLLGIVAGAGFVVLAVWLSTKLSLVPSALVLEQIPLRQAISRSWSLTKDHFWRIFGIQLLVNFILSAATQVAMVPFSIVFSILMTLVDPTSGGDSVALVWAGVTYLLMIMITVVLATITAIVTTAVSSLLYLDLRMRKEGLDLALTRFVESRQAGGISADNPYLRTAGSPESSAFGYTFA